MTTTALPTTSVPDVVATGWSAFNAGSLSEKAYPPCCADTWHGDASPALAPEGSRLADGPYYAKMSWPDDLAQPLEIELFRFEQCALLPAHSCDFYSEGPEYPPTVLSVDRSASRLETVTLDESIRVVVVGGGIESEGNFNVIEQGTGTDLAELAAEVEQAYAEVFADRFIAGEDPYAIITDVLDNPRGGFGPAERAYEAFVFVPQIGPPLLFQQVFPLITPVDGQRIAGRGTDVLTIQVVEVLDGQITLWVYAAYYS